MRQANRKFGRKTKAFSKRMEFHERQIAIWMLYRNYCWEPYPSRPRDGSSKWQPRKTGAEAAGLTDRTWKIDEFNKLSDDYRARRLADESGRPLTITEEASDVQYWSTTAPTTVGLRFPRPRAPPGIKHWQIPNLGRLAAAGKDFQRKRMPSSLRRTSNQTTTRCAAAA